MKIVLLRRSQIPYRSSFLVLSSFQKIFESHRIVILRYIYFSNLKNFIYEKISKNTSNVKNLLIKKDKVSIDFDWIKNYDLYIGLITWLRIIEINEKEIEPVDTGNNEVFRTRKRGLYLSSLLSDSGKTTPRLKEAINHFA